MPYHPPNISPPTYLPISGITQNEIDNMGVIQTRITPSPPAALLNEHSKLTELHRKVFIPEHGGDLQLKGPQFTSPSRPPTYITSEKSDSSTAITTAPVEHAPSSSGCARLADSATGVGSSSEAMSVLMVAEKLAVPIEHHSTETTSSIFLSAIPDHIRGRIHHKVFVSRGRSYVGNTPDQQLLLEFRRVAVEELRLSPPRWFSLRKLKHIYVIEYSINPASPPWHKYTDAARERELLCAYARPAGISTELYWIDWIYTLNESQQENVGLEFVQGWDVRKILILAMVPCVASVMTAIAWIVGCGDVQTAMAVASYILTLSGVLLTLLSVIGTLGI
ncbi:hypothetical protein DFP73DRAFT_596143 [Morchella snyderi]|nr:hypothetical protein DFP73DRAFT_596143 [Morchella snyderi]